MVSCGSVSNAKSYEEIGLSEICLLARWVKLRVLPVAVLGVVQVHPDEGV